MRTRAASAASESGNLERATAAYEAALTIRTREALPRAHLETSVGLGQTYLARHELHEAANAFSEARETFLLLFQQGLDEVEARGLIEVAGSLFTSAAYAAAALGNRLRLSVSPARVGPAFWRPRFAWRRSNLHPSNDRHLEALRAGIREQSRLLERAIGLERHDVLDG